MMEKIEFNKFIKEDKKGDKKDSKFEFFLKFLGNIRFQIFSID